MHSLSFVLFPKPAAVAEPMQFCTFMVPGHMLVKLWRHGIFHDMDVVCLTFSPTYTILIPGNVDKP